MIFMVAMLLMSSQLWAEKIYKWVDENGQIHYSSTKPEGQEAETVKVRKGPKVPPKPASEVAADDDKLPIDPDVAAAAKQQLAAADQANRSRQCEVARKNVAALNASVRVQRTNENGEKVRLTDEQRLDALQTAQQAIREFCQ